MDIREEVAKSYYLRAELKTFLKTSIEKENDALSDEERKHSYYKVTAKDFYLNIFDTSQCTITEMLNCTNWFEMRQSRGQFIKPKQSPLRNTVNQGAPYDLQIRLGRNHIRTINASNYVCFIDFSNNEWKDHLKKADKYLKRKNNTSNELIRYRRWLSTKTLPKAKMVKVYYDVAALCLARLKTMLPQSFFKAFVINPDELSEHMMASWIDGGIKAMLKVAEDFNINVYEMLKSSTNEDTRIYATLNAPEDELGLFSIDSSEHVRKLAQVRLEKK